MKPDNDKIGVGIIGCGAILKAYVTNSRAFPFLDLRACSDLDMARAKARAAELNIPKACPVEELLKDESIKIVLNLTVPKAHVPVGLQILEAGKHTYAEKPLGTDPEEGKKLLQLARKKKLRIGCAPDTFMGAGIQTARKLIDDGAIGRPIGFRASMLCAGHESWHPSPDFYYEAGGGPMFDMGPYYLTALLNLLGPVKRISGMASIAIPERTITSEPKKGKKITVETPDHINGLMEFENGATGTIITSFAVLEGDYDRKHPIIIHGTEGTLKVPDPNGFDGDVLLKKKTDADFAVVPQAFVTGYGRSVGLADMAMAIKTGRPHRAGIEMAYNVLEIMQGFLDTSNSGRTFSPKTRFKRPAPMPANLPFGTLDE